MLRGSLTYSDYKKLFDSDIILTNNLKLNQLQPSSIDLTLSDECYEINSSFYGIIETKCTLKNNVIGKVKNGRN